MAPASRRALRRRMILSSAAAGIAGLGLATGLGTPAGANTTVRFRQTNRYPISPGVARTTDPNLINPWGMSEFPGGPLWVSDNARVCPRSTRATRRVHRSARFR